MCCLPRLSRMFHPGLLVDRLLVWVHVQPQVLASHAGSHDTMHVTAELDEVLQKMALVYIRVEERSLEPKSGASEN